MTRKDYEKFAAMFAGEMAMAASSDQINGGKSRRQWAVWNIVLSTADIFAQNNPRFDRGRFYDACGGAPQ